MYSMLKYKYTKPWFINSEISKILLNFIDKNKKRNILEIGCFEGLSSCYFSDMIMDNEESKMYCVDPFYPSGTVKGITSQCIDSNTINMFLDNIKLSKNYKNITFHNKTSDDFFITNTILFDFIYIDGCHELDYIERDVENSFKVLKVGGIMWMDDYGGGDPPDRWCRIPINNFLIKNKEKVKIIHKNYQLAIEKLRD